MPTSRVVLISTVQYESELRSGANSFDDIVNAAKRLGVDGVEFRDVYWKDKEHDIANARGAVTELGLVATYATFVTLFDATANRGKFRQAVDEAAALGSPLLRIFPGEVPPSDATASWSAASDAIEYAASQQVTVALENFAGTPGRRLDEVKAVLDRIQSPALGTNLDIGNYAQNGQDVIPAIRTLGERIVSSHLKDVADTSDGPRSTYLGDGRLALAAILAEFDRLPQKILHCFEFGGGGDPEGRIVKSLELFRAN